MPSTETAGAAGVKITLPCPACGTWNRVDSSRADAGPRCGSCARPLALDQPLSLGDATFDRVLAENATLPVLVDFYADWCAPCRMMAPSIAKLASEHAGRAIIAKVDTEAAPRVAERLRIHSLPTTILFRAGREARREVGALPLERLRAVLR